jgi:tetratricopeptide (TPR) repeat protein
MNKAITLLLALATTATSAFAGVDDDVRQLQSEWAQIKYVKPKADQEKSYAALAQTAAAVRDKYPTRAEPLIWYGIIVASQAGVKGGVGALPLVKDAKSALEHAIELDRNALDGSAYTTLGSLYYMVPGWPIAFGDDKKAMEMLQAALAVNPNGVDANFFMGDLLYRKGDYAGARSALTKGLNAPPRPDRPVADEGRRKEIEELLAKVREKTG